MFTKDPEELFLLAKQYNRHLNIPIGVFRCLMPSLDGSQ